MQYIFATGAAFLSPQDVEPRPLRRIPLIERVGLGVIREGADMLPLNSIIAVYERQSDAEEGLLELQRAGFDLKRVSILGKENEVGEQVVGHYNTGGRMKYVGARGAFWNDLWRRLPGAACFDIPGIGRILMAGPMTVWSVSASEDLDAEGLTTLGAGLFSLNIPKGSVRRYESAIKAHKLLLVAHGAPQELLRSREVLRASRPDEMDLHFAEDGVRSAA
jgi:hypothetical protein